MLNPMRQVKLRALETLPECAYKGYTVLTCWLPLSSDILPGRRLTLDADNYTREWEVVEVYRDVIVEKSQLHRAWRVGGLK